MLQLLQYHVVPGMAMTTSTLTNGQTLTTALTGQTLKVRTIWLHEICVDSMP